jgi:hypothetical protein
VEAMPADGLVPQPYIQVISRFKCRDCPFISKREVDVLGHEDMTSHGPDTIDIREVRVQTWFGEEDTMGWRVDESIGNLVLNVCKMRKTEAVVEDVGMEQPKVPGGGISYNLWHEDSKEREREHELVGITPAWQTQELEDER